MADPVLLGFREKYGPNRFNGLPFIGQPMNRKEDDPDYKQPLETSLVHVRQFDTTNEKHMAEWSEIMQRVADGVTNVSFEEKVYDPDIKGWRILLRWVDFFYTNPEEPR
jgi:hypothetical protein